MQIQVQFGPLDEKKIKQLELINLACLPVIYQQSTYQKIIDLYLENSRFAYFNDIAVGAIVTRLEPRFDHQSCYIMTLGVLKPYRRLNIGSQIITELTNNMKDKKDIKAIYLHVQTNNEIALQFYQKLGFKIVEKVNDYYTNIDPNDAFLLQKFINQE